VSIPEIPTAPPKEPFTDADMDPVKLADAPESVPETPTVLPNVAAPDMVLVPFTVNPVNVADEPVSPPVMPTVLPNVAAPDMVLVPFTVNPANVADDEVVRFAMSFCVNDKFVLNEE
jgi:hypothetical protein